ncbi:protein of unknown function DUF1080 [Pirellula staleyi DSM 6068]|uniref:3-keto-alpha-glucoside-1,2-lyase/3-keto-2-hydroxy-glucal hydratase domain-containing protein n=1 Tax=Pirellula staleyi (strain ATCC 27377 / DSM 6068 / ICPB 4128) TaxID=530564 RepID=D2R082_PIRSD|nr:family 16 glycoside hydrolase [Pirellula staleyi]ADB18447.1 protein of unknown function DUF1080 [Pirellula staleyi DSM 6068]
MIRLHSAVVAMLLAISSWASAEEGFTPLFDGKSLAGWSGHDKFWSVKDGAITGQTTPENPTQGNTFLLWKDEVANFHLKLKFRIVGGNSGIQYRSKHEGNFVVGGYQADIDSTDTYIGILYEERGRGILAERSKKVEISESGEKKVVGETADSKAILESIKKEDWNEYEVIAKGNELTQKINGMVTIHVIDNEKAKAATKGVLALQLHAGPPMLVQFKDIEIKTLD